LETESESGTRAALTTLRVLETVSDLQPAGVSAIARAAGIPKSSAQRCLHTLREAGWLALAPSDRTRWVLTGKALTVGLRASADVGLRETARGTMEWLRDETGETIHLSGFSGDATRPHESLVIVDRLDSTQPVRTWVRLGTVVPLHASSSGRAVLAQLPHREVEALLEEPLERYAENTLATVDDVMADLRMVRERGYATVESGWRAGVGAVGAALLDSRQRPVGALAISMPAQRYDRKRARELGPRVAVAAREISDTLGAAR
jgi:DNA-binding IclR family transcriptional regulator